MTLRPILSRYCRALDLTKELEGEAWRGYLYFESAIAKTKTDPRGWLAALLYIHGVLMGERRTMREICDVVPISENLLRKRYRDVARDADVDLVLGGTWPEPRTTPDAEVAE